MIALSVIIASLAFLPMEFVVIYAQTGNAEIPPIASVVEVTALVGVVSGSVLKQIQIKKQTKGLDNADHGAMAVAIIAGLMLAVTEFTVYQIPANVPSLLTLFIVNLVTGFGLQSGASYVIPAFGKIREPASVAKA